MQNLRDREYAIALNRRAKLSRRLTTAAIISLTVLVGCVGTQQTQPLPQTAATSVGIGNDIYFVISNDSFIFHSCPIVDNKLSLRTKFRDAPCAGSFFVRGGIIGKSIPVELADGTTTYLVRFREGLLVRPNPAPSVLVGYKSSTTRVFELLSGKQARFALLPTKIIVLGDPLAQDNNPQDIADQIAEIYPSLAPRLDVGEPIEFRCGGTRKDLLGILAGSEELECTVEPASG